MNAPNDYKPSFRGLAPEHSGWRHSAISFTRLSRRNAGISAHAMRMRAFPRMQCECAHMRAFRACNANACTCAHFPACDAMRMRACDSMRMRASRGNLCVSGTVEEVPYCSWRSSVKFQGHAALKSVKLDPDWVFPDCYSSLNSPMAAKWYTKLEGA